MIRVLHFQLARSIGGIEAVQKNLYSHIDRSAFAFDFAAKHKDAPMAPYMQQLGGKVHVLPPVKSVLSYCMAIYRILKKERYDVVHFHKNSCANPLPCMMAKIAGVKHIVLHSHNTGSTGGRLANVFHYAFRPLFCLFADERIACSKEAGQWMFGNKPYKLLNNGIDVTRYAYQKTIREEMRTRLQLQGKIVIGHVGNYIPQKNHSFVIDIMAEIVKENPDAVLLLAGRGDAMKDIQAYAREKGVEDYVRFLGARTDVENLYQAMDVFLFPSLHEGFPVVGVEAQAAGLPCLFSTAITESVVLTDQALRLPLSWSAEQWAKQVIASAHNAQREKNADQLAKSDFSADKMARKMEQIYFACCGIQ